MGKSDSNRQYILLPQDCIHVWMQGDSFSFCFFFLKIHALNVILKSFYRKHLYYVNIFQRILVGIHKLWKGQQP